MEEMKNDALEKIAQIFYGAILKSNSDKTVYKDIGKNYIRFAKDEPMFFNLLFNSDENKEMQHFVDLTASSYEILETLSAQSGLSKEDAVNFHLRMWLYVNGIANLVANRTVNFTDEDIDQLLSEQYLSMILYEVRRGKLDEKVLDIFFNTNKKDE